MRFTYEPEGMEARSWLFEPRDFTSTDAELVEKRSGMKFHEWVNEVQGGSITAAHALLFVLLRKDKPGLEWDSVVFKPRDIGWEYTDAELMFYNAALVAKASAGDLSDVESSILRSIQADAQRRGVNLEPDPEAEDPAEGEDPTSPVSVLESAPAKRRKAS